MAKSYDELSIMAARFGYRLADARKGSQHRGAPVRYLLEEKSHVSPFRNLGEVERKAPRIGARASEAQSGLRGDATS